MHSAIGAPYAVGGVASPPAGSPRLRHQIQAFILRGNLMHPTNDVANQIAQ